MPNTARITKWGNGSGLRIPAPLLKQLSINQGDEVIISVDGDEIIIKAAKPRGRKTLAERFENYTGPMKLEEMDWGEPRGKEVF